MAPRPAWICCVLGLGLVLNGLATPAGAAEIDPYLPDESDLVLSINVRQVIDSPVFKKYALESVREWIKTDPRTQALALLGLDPLKGVSRIELAGPASSLFSRQGLAIVHGTFDVARIESGADLLLKVDPTALKIRKRAAVRLYELRNKKHPDPVFIAFLDKQTLVVSPVEDLVAEAIDKSAGKKETILPKSLQTLIGQQDDKQSLWLAGGPGDLLRELAKNPRLQARLANVRSLSGTVHLGEDARIDLRVETSNLRSGAQLRQYLELTRAATILAVTSNDNLADAAPLLTGVLTTLQIAQQRGTILIQAAIAPDLIERWVTKETRKKVEATQPEGPHP